MTLSVAIAGAGFVGGVHARSARLAGATLVGITASTPQRSAEAAQRFGAQRVFVSSEELVTAPDVDVVHICTPNNSHAPLALAALEAGKHVICEKPLALDSTEA
ncbi:MAG: Gfo/Idh/MocA family protein, partial [Jatrophihabitans sp.]